MEHDKRENFRNGSWNLRNCSWNFVAKQDSIAKQMVITFLDKQLSAGNAQLSTEHIIVKLNQKMKSSLHKQVMVTHYNLTTKSSILLVTLFVGDAESALFIQETLLQVA